VSVVLTQNSERAPVDQFVEGFDVGSIDEAPGELRLVAVSAKCAVTKPTAGQRVTSVALEPADVPTQVYSYPSDVIARGVAYEMGRIMGHGIDTLTKVKSIKLNPDNNLAMNLVSVIIPPGPEPVYLVIKDGWSGAIWNILPMPGATLAHVTLLSNGSSGVVNLPDGVGLDVPDLASGPCAAFGRLIEDPKVTEAEGFVPSDDTRERWAKYSDWFAENFGVPADQGQTGRYRAAFVLGGDVPPAGAAKAAWQGPAGKVIHIMPAEILYASSKKDHEAWFAAKASEMITSAFGAPAGSDVIALMKPVVQERIN
jgi:hypothetical protein